MKKVQVTIEGTSPLLMNKFSNETYLAQKQIRKTTKQFVPEEEAEESAYWTTKGKKELMIPSEVLYAAMLNGAAWHKVQKRSAKSILAGSVRVEPMEISLGTNKFEIDTRAVVIQRQRVLKSRARIPEWKATFDLIYNEQLIADPQILKIVLEEAGQRVGIMSFRPQKAGPFGTFKITKFKLI
jgi:hypothetical protein